MSDQLDFGALRSLLQAPPSLQGWQALCVLLDAPAWDEAAPQWLPYAQSHLDRGWPDHLREWPEPWWGRVRQPAAVALVRAFAPSSPTVRQIERLCDTIAACAVPLREVRLRLSAALPDEPVARLGRALAPAVRALDLGPSLANQALLAGLLEASAGALHTLRISGRIDAPMLLASLLGDGFPALTSLALDYAISDQRALQAALAAPSARGRLTSLHLDGAPLGSQGAQLLARWEWRALRHLSIQRTQVHDEGLCALLANMPALRSLNVSECPLVDTPARWFELSSALRLSALVVNRTGPQPTHAGLNVLGAMYSAALLALPQLEPLTSLSLRELTLEPPALRALLSRFAGQLEHLDLSYTRAPALWEVLRGTRWPALTSLVVHGAPADAQAALASMELPALTQIDLQFATITHDGLAQLERAPWRAQLAAFFPPQPR